MFLLPVIPVLWLMDEPWLSSLGATVKGFSLKPTASHSLYEGMQLCSNIETTFGDVRDFSPEKVFERIFRML